MKRSIIATIVFGLMATLALAVPVFAATTTTDPQPHFTDGRINHSDASPFAVFGDGESLAIWAPIYSVEEADGTRTYYSEVVLDVTAEDIAAIPALPEENTLIAATEDMSVAVYRLTSGEYQLNAWTDKGEMYTLRFPELYADAGYESEFVK